MYVRVYFDDDDGNFERVHSALTGVVLAASNPKKPNAPRQVEVESGGKRETLSVLARPLSTKV